MLDRNPIGATRRLFYATSCVQCTIAKQLALAILNWWTCSSPMTASTIPMSAFVSHLVKTRCGSMAL